MLDLAANGAAGSGAISFANAVATVRVETGVALGNTLDALALGDVIDLQGIGLAGAATLDATAHTLTLSGGGVASSVVLRLDPAESFANQIFTLAADGAGGTSVTLATPPTPVFIDQTPKLIGHGQTVQIGTVTPNVTDDPLTLTQFTGLGTLTLTGGIVSFTPPAGASGVQNFSFTVSDQFGNATPFTQDHVTVDPGPGVTDLTTPGETIAGRATVTVGTVTPGVAGDTLTLHQLSGPAGALALTGGAVTLAPAGLGPVTVSYTITDQLGDVSPTISDTLTAQAVTNFTITSAADLANAVRAIDAGGADAFANTAYTFTFAPAGGGTIALTQAIGEINIQAGSSLIINGNGNVLDGGGTQLGLFVDAGAVTVNNLAIDNMLARGGDGGRSGSVSGSSGGGAGLGGGLFIGANVAGDAGDVTLNGVTFAGDAAKGGNGAAGSNGGGGGLDSLPGTMGGINADGVGGGGGGSGAGAAGADGSGGAGGFGGGGGTAGLETLGRGGAGGFGGGGGAADLGYAGIGGFGGGGGSGQGGGGRGGFGAGHGDFDDVGQGGGGGLGAGADIFAQVGASLTIRGGSLAAGTVAGGTPGTDGTGGLGLANGLFIDGGQQVTLAPGLGQTLAIAGVIADEGGSGGTGAGSLLLDGQGTVQLAAANTFIGGITMSSGTLDLAATGAAGSGAISFAQSVAALVVNQGVALGNTLDLLAAGDSIDFRNVGLAVTAVIDPVAHTLTLSGGGLAAPITVNLDPTQSFARQGFALTSDGAGGTFARFTNLTPNVADETRPFEEVGHGQTIAAASVAPGLPSDTLTLTQFTGTPGALSLANGVVSFTTPAAVDPSNPVVSYSYQISDQAGDVSPVISDSLVVDGGPAVTDRSSAGQLVGHGQVAVIGVAIPGIAGDTLMLTQLSGPAGALSLIGGGGLFTAPATSGSAGVSYTITDQLGDVSPTLTDSFTIDPGPSVTDTTTPSEFVVYGTPLAIGTVSPGVAGDVLTLHQSSGPSGALSLANGVVSLSIPAATGGPLAISYTVTDQLGDVSRTVTDTLNAIYDVGPSIVDTTAPFEPVAHGATIAVGTVTPGLPGDTLTLTELSGPAGALALSGGTVEFTAPGGAGGNVTYAYQITDQLGDVSRTVTDMLAVDPGPAITDATTPGEKVANGAMTAIGTVTPGLAGDTLTLTQLSGAAGAVTLLGSTVFYAAPLGGHGPVAVSYTISDQLGDASPPIADTLSVDPGPAIADSTTAGETVLQGATIVVGSATPGLAGDTLTLEQLSGPSGLLALANGVVSFTAPAGASGSVGFSYTVSDQLGDVSRMVSDSLNVLNDPGPSVTDTTTVGEKVAHGTAVAVATVLPGLPGDTLTLTQLSGPAGALSLSHGLVSFAAPAGASGATSVSYTVHDQFGGVSRTVSDTIAVDPGPTAGPLAAAIKLGAAANLTAAILGVDHPGLAGDTLKITAVGTTSTLGAVSLVGGQLVYTASGAALQHIAANGTLADHFTYTVTDQLGETAAGTVTETITNAATVINGPCQGHATIEGTAGADIITAHGSGNTIFDNGGNDGVDAGQTSGEVYVGGGDVVVTLHGLFNGVQGAPGQGPAATAGADGNVTVQGTASLSAIRLGNGQDTIRLTGGGDLVSLGNGGDTVALSGGANLITLGSGNDTVSLAGGLNAVSLGAGTDTVNASTGDFITLTATNLLLHGGISASVFVHAGTSSLDDLSTAMTAYVGPGSGSLIVKDFGQDRTGVIDLLGGIGGFHSAASVVSALHSDGHGGTLLALGSAPGSSTIDFINTGTNGLGVAHFHVG